MLTISCEVVFGVETDVIHAYNGDEEGSQDLDIFFVPGNPGTLEFYTDFLDKFLCMCRAIKDLSYRINLHAVGHANHHLNKASDASDNEHTGMQHGLDFQIQHLDCFIESIMSASNAKLLLIGHSIGCYMILEVICSNVLVRERTVEIIQLMPFMIWQNIPTHHKTLLQTYIKTLPYSLYIIRQFAYRFISLPSTCRWIITRLSTTLSEPYLSIVSDRLFSRRLVKNFLRMGEDEIRKVPQNEAFMLSLLKEFDHDKIGICSIYTQADVWAPLEDMDVLRSVLKHNCDHIFVCDNVTHGFSLVPHGDDEVLRAISTYFQRRELRCPEWNIQPSKLLKHS
jgi:hypothetical protein